MEIKDKKQDDVKENISKQWIGDIAKENFIENNNNINNDEKEEIKSYNDKKNIFKKSNSTNNINEIKIINKPNLNYDYGDSIDSILFNEITNNNIKYNISATNKKINEVINNNKYNNGKINNNTGKIINIKYDLLSNKNIDSTGTKPCYNLYNEFKKKYKNNKENMSLENNSLSERSYFTNYLSINTQRNYLTLDPNHASNNMTYNILDNQFKTPLRNEYENKTNNINLNFTEYKINSYTPSKYFNLNNNKTDIDSSKNTYLENKISEQQKIIEKYENDIYNYKSEIKIFKNLIKIITEFFDFLSKKYIPELIPKDKMLEINNEKILHTYFKKIEEYIININKEMNDYKYKYQKLLDLDSSLHFTINKENYTNENKKQNTFPENNDIINEKFTNYFESSNSINEIDIYKTLEQRVFLLEKELFNKKNQEINGNIRNKSRHKIIIKKDRKKKINQDKYNNNIDEKVNQNNLMDHPKKNSKMNFNNKGKNLTKKKLYKSSKKAKK